MKYRDISLLTLLFVSGIDVFSQDLIWARQTMVFDSLMPAQPLDPDSNSLKLPSGFYHLTTDTNGHCMPLDKTNQIFRINPIPILTVENMVNFQLFKSKVGPGEMGLAIWLDEGGTERWFAATRQSIGKQLALIIDNKLIQVSIVQSEISNGVAALNRGTYTSQELKQFRTRLIRERSKVSTSVKDTN